MLQYIPMQPFKKQSRNFKIEPKSNADQSVDTLVGTNEEVSIILPSKMKNLVPTGAAGVQQSRNNMLVDDDLEATEEAT